MTADPNKPFEDAPDAADPTTETETPEEAVIVDLHADDGGEERLAALIDSEAPTEDIAREMASQQGPDAADVLESLIPADSASVLHSMEAEAAAEALSYMEPALAATVLEDLPVAESGALLGLMESDDAADILQSLHKDLATRVLRAMPRMKAARLGQLALYDPETAGGVMNIDYLWLDAEGTVSDAIEVIRSHPQKMETGDLLCLDRNMHLAGEVDVRSLLVNPPATPLTEIMSRELEVVRPEIDREEVAMAFDRYDYVTLPVVDENQRVLGIVTIDDVVDIIREEHSEDTFKQVGAGLRESVNDRLPRKLRGRAPWLLINLGTSLVAAAVVARFQGVIESITLLAVLMPVIANQAGNAGQQSLAVTLRGLVLGEVRRGRTVPLLVREVLLGFVSGLVVGAVVAGAVTLLALLGVANWDWRVGVIAGLAMAGALTVGCLAGTGIPLLLEKIGLDPATGSTIFLTMLTDSISFFIFLGLAFVLQAWLLSP